MRNRQCLCDFAPIACAARLASVCPKQRFYRLNRLQISQTLRLAVPRTIALGRANNIEKSRTIILTASSRTRKSEEQPTLRSPITHSSISSSRWMRKVSYKAPIRFVRCHQRVTELRTFPSSKSSCDVRYRRQREIARNSVES